MKKLWQKTVSTVLSAMLVLTFAMPQPQVFAADMPNASQPKEKTIQILETSDVHGRFDAFSYADNRPDDRGSLTQISQKVKQLRQQNPNTLLVDAGDTVQDNMANYFLNDPIHPMFVAMNAMKYDTWTVGNHEFNYGKKMVEKIVTEPTASVLCGNIYKEDGKRLGKPYVIKTVDGVRIAVIGMTTPNILRWDGAKLQGYKVTSPVKETRAAIDEIKKAKSADFYVAVVHMGLNNEYREDDSATALAKACPELTAIFAGHAHRVENTKVGNTVIVEPGKFGRMLSQVKITVQEAKDGYAVTNVTANNISMKSQPVDQELNAKLKPFHDRAQNYCEEVVGTLAGGPLAPKSQFKALPQAQVQDTALIDLILDTQMHYTQQYVPKGAHFVSSAALLDTRSNIQAGTIHRYDLLRLYKFENSLCVVKLTGKQLKQYMEWSASYYNQYHDGDTQITANPDFRSYSYDMFAGVNYEINISKPAGSRIENLTYTDGTTVADNDEIYLAANDYCTSSRLNSGLFKDKPLTILHKTTDDKLVEVRDMIVDYVKNVKHGKITNDCKPNWKITGCSLLNVPAAKDEDVVIVHTNDVHGNVVGNVRKDKNIVKPIGLDRVKAIRDSIGTENSLLFDAGDAVQGTPFASITQGNDIIKLMNAAGYDMMALGNHEFDYGLSGLYKNIDLANFTVMSSNVTGTPRLDKLPKTKVFEKKGKRIGVFALTTPETPEKTNPVELKENHVVFADPVKTAQTMVDELKKQNVDAIVCVAHLGDDPSSGHNRSSEVAKNVKGIDVIIDGHSHIEMMGSKAERVNGTLIVQTGHALANVGKVTLHFTKNGVLTDSQAITGADAYSIVPDAKVKAQCDELKKSQEKLYQTIIGKTATPLYGGEVNGINVCRLGETNLGDLVTDSMVNSWYEMIGQNKEYNEKYGSLPVVAYCDGGSIRTTIPAGDISIGQIKTVLPWAQADVYLLVSPYELYQITENGVGKITGQDPKTGRLSGIDGRFPQVSGLSYTYDFTKKPQVVDDNFNITFDGERVTKIQLKNGKVLDRNDKNPSIVLVTSEYQIGGGDGYYTIAKVGKMANRRLGIGLAQNTVFENYIKNVLMKNAPKEGFTVPMSEGRIRIAHPAYTKPDYRVSVSVADEKQKPTKQMTFTLLLDGKKFGTAKTDEKGVLTVENIPVGPHTLTLQAQGNEYAFYTDNFTCPTEYSLVLKPAKETKPVQDGTQGKDKQQNTGKNASTDETKSKDNAKTGAKTAAESAVVMVVSMAGLLSILRKKRNK